MTDFEAQIIGAIYDAALEPDRWPALLEIIREATTAKHAVVSFYDACNRTRNFVRTAGASSAEEAIYLSDYIDLDAVWLRRIFSKSPIEEPVPSQRFENISGLTKNELLGEHREFMDIAGINHHVYTPLIASSNIVSALSVHRGMDKSEFGIAETSFLKTLAPHIAKAVRIHNQLSAARSQNERLLDTLKHASAGILLLDADLRVVFSNPEAARVLEKHPALQVGRFGKLATPQAAQQRTLQQLLARVAAQGMASAVHSNGISIALHHEHRLQPLKLTVVSLMSSGLDPSLAAEKICIAMFVSDPDRTWIIPREYLKEAYGLTPTECVIAESLLNGASAMDIANQRGTTQNTTRWQLKCLLQKTHSKNQAELVRLLVALSSDLSLPI